MSRIIIRLAVANDQRRLLAGGLLGPRSARSTWDARLNTWFAEHKRAHRLIILADDSRKILGMVHILFKPPKDHSDPEVVNGKDVALMEFLRIRPKILTSLADQVADHLEHEAETLALKRNMTRLTYMIPEDLANSLSQARNWGFVEFRVMPDRERQVIFLRKRLDAKKQ